ncbi:MAG: tripartite tricarboxylate transporter TctB family protein [Burkholderiaceae bacterium]
MSRTATRVGFTWLPALGVTVLAAVIAWHSFDADDARAYLFPRLVSVAMLLFAFVNLLQSLRARASEPRANGTLRHALPGLTVLAIYVFWGAEALGFYLAGAVTVFTIHTLYDPAPRTPRRIAAQAGVGVGTAIVLYLLFSVVLQVQLPRGILI